MNPTIIGLFSIMVWGLAAPIVRILTSYLSVYAYTGLIFAMIGMLGLGYHLFRKTKWDKAIFRNKYLYGRWFFFCAHTIAFLFSVALVQIEHLPLVILLNYLWPTAVILYSVLLAGVHVTRWGPFVVGLLLVFAALSFEIAGEVLFSGKLTFTSMDYVAFFIVFLGANAWGLYSALSRRAAKETGEGSVIPFFQITLSLFLPYALISDANAFTAAPWWIYPALLLYACLSLLAYLSWDLGMRKGSIVVLSLAADLIPWISLTGAWLLLDIEISTKTVLTAILLVFGATITRYGTLQPGTGLFGTKQPPAEADVAAKELER